MDGDGKKPLKTAITDFYNLNLKKEKNMQWNTSKKVCTGLQSLGGLKSLKPLEIAIENMDPESNWVHVANQNGLQSLLKFWNDLFKLFVTQSC